jgi:succinyl-CoA synthetase beta subunit
LGGQAIHEQIEALLYLLQNDPNVKVILINVFGGILNVDKVIATLDIQI